MKRSFFAFLIFLHAAFAVAGPGGSSQPDPNQLGSIPVALGCTINTNTSAVTLQAAQNPVAGNHYLVAIVDGQSNGANIIPTLYTPTNAGAILQMNIGDGGVYSILDPVLGTCLNAAGSGWSVLKLFDDLITAGKFDHVLVEPINVDGTAAADHASGALVGRLATAINRLAAKGWVAGANITVIVIWMQGETDNINATTQVNYTATLNSLIAQSRTAGFAGPWFIAEETWDAGAASTAVQLAQTSASPSGVINNAAGVYAFANFDSLVGSVCTGSAPCRQADNTHFTTAARANISTIGQAALHASGISPF
jgi:hypothetical protein